jgi:hypothetical protein
MSRTPDNGNDPPQDVSKVSPWLELNPEGIADETALLIQGSARRCKECKRATRVKHLNDAGLCPDCRN